MGYNETRNIQRRTRARKEQVKTMKYGFGADVGGTTVKIGLFDNKGTMLESWEILTRKEKQGSYIIGDICRAINGKLAQRGIDKEEVIGIGMGVPGPVSGESTVINCVNLGWGTFDVGAEMEKISGLQSEIDEKIADGKYKEAEEQLNELDSLMEEASRKKEGLNVAIEQYDYSAYPNVENSETGIYENRKVVNAVQMEGHAGLNIALAADVSSSMRTDNRIDGAKFVMQNFIAQVHFTEGDLVKMIPFSNHVRGNGYFSPDGPAVQREIAGYTADGGTALYDAILYSVQDVLRQPGAKCVVAFTDGHDEHSSTTPQDLINTVRYAGVPVYIVRVGGYTGSDANYDGVLRQIAESSGGSFRVVSNFNEDMSQFYAQIYHQIKQYYMLEYTDTGSSLFDARGVNVYVESGDRGGEDTKSVIPSDVLFSMCCDVTD